MVLSTDLISQFAKITKDEKSEKKETTVYGTIAEYAGRKCVKLDGSELYTPVMTTVEAEIGERVTVLLKNHTATVTGNITSPAVRTETVRIVVDNVTELEHVLGDTVKKEELLVEQERITSLESRIVTMDERVTSLESRIVTMDERVTSLENQIVTMNESMTALNTAVNEMNAIISALEARIAALEGGA